MLHKNHGKFTQEKCMHTNTLLCAKTHYCVCTIIVAYLRKRKTPRQCFTHGMCKFAEMTNKTEFFQQYLKKILNMKIYNILSRNEYNL